MTVKLKPITETSWLVIGDTDDTRIGLLTESRNQYILMSKGQKTQFLSRKEVNGFFQENIFGNMMESPKEMGVGKKYFINGFPVEFDSPHEVIIKGNSLPLYSKKPTSDVFYSAGYYCLNFTKNWMPGFCPKLSTLILYEYAGPFSTEIEMRSVLSKLRKEKK